MTNKEAAKILRDVCRQALPTVNGIPFTEIKEALVLGAEALDPTPERNCAECVHKTTTRTESGTIQACSVWKCNFAPLSRYQDDIDALIEEERMLDKDDDTLKKGGEV